jgi:predicted amidohydrolase
MSYVVGVNRIGTDPNGHTYNGHSAVYDPLGTQLAFSEQEAILRVTLDKSSVDQARRSLKFLQDRDTFILES